METNLEIDRYHRIGGLRPALNKVVDLGDEINIFVLFKGVIGDEVAIASSHFTIKRHLQATFNNVGATALSLEIRNINNSISADNENILRSGGRFSVGYENTAGEFRAILIAPYGRSIANDLAVGDTFIIPLDPYLRYNEAVGDVVRFDSSRTLFIVFNGIVGEEPGTVMTMATVPPLYCDDSNSLLLSSYPLHRRYITQGGPRGTTPNPVSPLARLELEEDGVVLNFESGFTEIVPGFFRKRTNSGAIYQIFSPEYTGRVDRTIRYELYDRSFSDGGLSSYGIFHRVQKVCARY